MLRGTTFGQCRFETATSRIEPDADVHFGLLLLLAAADGDGLAREEIVRTLWPRGAEGGRHCLRQTLYRLRQLNVRLRSRAGRVALAGDDVACDLRDLLYGMPTRDQMIRLGTLPFLPSYAPRLGDTFRGWLDELRAHVAGRLRQVLAAEVGVARANARFHEVGRISRALLAQDPLNEVGTLGLAESMALEGSKVEALRMLEDYEEEVGEISEELRIAPRTLRRRVSECLDDALLPRRFDVPFVGRDREYAELRTAYQEARNGAARCAVVTGEAGIGKTRLASEVMRLAALDGTTATAYAASAGDSFTPISTLVSVGHLLLSLPGALGCAHEHLQYLRRLGTPETVSVWGASGMAADIAYAQLVHALAELVRALADEAPLILFIDDAQRLHQTSWRVLFDVLDRVREARFLLVMATRRLPVWFGSVCRDTCGHLTRNIRLAPFSAEESLAFMRLWSDKNRVSMPDGDAASCTETSAGNPFYLGELAAHVVRGGDLRLAPKSIRELIELQYAAVSKGAQRLLLVIALFEGRATLGRVTQVMDLGADEFMASLDEIEEAGLIAAKGPSLRCKHELVAETAIGLAMEGVQAFARVRIAELLEQEADATNSVELLGDCVTHWERAGEMRRAYLAAMKLGSRLVGLGMGTEAERAYERACACADSADEIMAALEGGLVASHLAARWSHVETLARKSREIAAKSAGAISTKLENDLRAQEASLYSITASPNPDELHHVAGDRSRDPILRLRAAALLVIYGDNTFDAAAMNRAIGAVVDLDSGGADIVQAVLLHLVYHTIIGDRHEAEHLARRLQHLASQSPDYSMRVQGLRRAGVALLRLGKPEAARDVFEESLQIATRLQLPLQEVACFENLLCAAIARDDLESADRCAQEVRRRREAEPEFVDLLSLAIDSRLAWIHNDSRHSPELLSRARGISQPAMTRAAQTLLTIHSSAALLIGCEHEEHESIRSLEVIFHRGSGFGDQDFAASVLIAAHHRLNESAHATSLLSSYMERRRELFPFPTCFGSAMYR